MHPLLESCVVELLQRTQTSRRRARGGDAVLAANSRDARSGGSNRSNRGAGRRAAGAWLHGKAERSKAESLAEQNRTNRDQEGGRHERPESALAEREQD